MILFIQAIQSKTAGLGYLIIDDVIIRKPFGKSIFPTSYVYDHTNNRYVWGMHIVVLLWSNGWIKIPVTFRIWKPEERCEEYHTKVELAIRMISFAHKFGLAAEYVTFDTWYSCKELLQKLSECGYHYVCMIKNNRKVLYNNRVNFNVKTISLLFNRKQYRYYSSTGFYIKALTVILPCVGNVMMAIVKNGYNASIQKTRFIITDLPDVATQDILKKYLCRWDIEVFFKMCKSYLKLAKEFQGHLYDMMVAHTTIVFSRYIMLAVENRNNTDLRTIGALFYYCCDELEDIKFLEALQLIIEALKIALQEKLFLTKEAISEFLDYFVSSLPDYIKVKLTISSCES
jgi:hypothetical protein